MSVNRAAMRSVPLLTLKRCAQWEGIGLHSGEWCRVAIEPSDEPGVRFRLGGVEVPADIVHVFDTERCTSLGSGGTVVGTTEHLMAALTGVGIWSAVITTEGPELPILDGSARDFTEGLRAAGTREIGVIAALVPPPGQVEDESGCRRWLPSIDAPRVSFRMRGDHPHLIGQETSASLADPDEFAEEIAPCRTWVIDEQVRRLRERNLIRGGSLDSAVIVTREGYSSPLRRECEPARHKLLDLIGDLALVGRPVLADITAVGGGHSLNARMARVLRELLDESNG